MPSSSVSVHSDSAFLLSSDSLPVAPSSVPLQLLLAPMAPLVACLVFCVAKLLRPLLLYGSTSIRYISLEGVSLHLLSFNILIVLFVPTLLVNLLILLGGLLVSVLWETLTNVVLIS